MAIASAVLDAKTGLRAATGVVAIASAVLGAKTGLTVAGAAQARKWAIEVGVRRLAATLRPTRRRAARAVGASSI